MVPEEDSLNWDNSIKFYNFSYTLNFNRGSSPNNAKGVITVGALSNDSDFRRSLL